MSTYIALLKGINVGGHKKIFMAELRELLTKRGFRNVKTYIQSGNIIFKSTLKNKADIEEKIQQFIVSYFGFEVSVIVKTRNDLQRIFNTCPLSEEKKQVSYFVILKNTPSDVLIEEVSKKVYDNEWYTIKGDVLFFYSDKGFGRAKFNVNYFERNLKTIATVRNYKTMLKLLSLSSD